MSVVKTKKNFLEKTVFGVSLLFIIALLSYLIYESLNTDQTQLPIIELYTDPVQKYNSQFVVPVILKNMGHQTAEAVKVEVTLVKDEIEIEKGEFEIDFLPRFAEKRGFVSFVNDPTQARILHRVKGYKIP